MMKYGHLPLLFEWQGIACFAVEDRVNHSKTLKWYLYIVLAFENVYKFVKLLQYQFKKQWHVTIFHHFTAKL